MQKLERRVVRPKSMVTRKGWIAEPGYSAQECGGAKEPSSVTCSRFCGSYMSYDTQVSIKQNPVVETEKGNN